MTQNFGDPRVARATDRQTDALIQGLTPLNRSITDLNSKVDQLNANIQASSASTERLARALNWLTLAGAAVAFLGVIVAAVELAHHW